MTAFKKILVSTDFSDVSSRAIDFVRDRSAFDGTEIVLVHAFESPFQPVHHVIQLTTREELEREAETACGRSLAEVAKTLEVGARSVRTVLRSGAPSDVILELAKEEQPDMIVISSHGYRGVQRFVLGSTTERVLRQADCPVLTVR